VVGPNRWRNPEADLPTDFETNREVHYARRQTLDPSAFIDELRGRHWPNTPERRAGQSVGGRAR
jgi:hypothetical protein